MINPNLDTDNLTQSFNLDKRVRIDSFLQADVAERIHAACIRSVPYSTQYVIDGQYQSKTPEQISKLSLQEKQLINQQIASAASKGIGFLYDGYLKSRIQKSVDPTTGNDLSFLHSVFDYLGSKEVLDTIKEVTENQDITRAEPQYTRYTQGHFLTRHLDVVPGRGRRIAFVLGLSKKWHPDWGGLLQFYAKDGTPRDAWIPQFNVLSIFEVSHIHAVTYVTPYAAEPRLSLTGWFIADG